MLRINKKLTFSDAGFFSIHFKTKLLCKKPGPHTQVLTNEKPSQKEKSSSSNHQFSKAKCEFQGGVIHPTWMIIPFRKYLSTNHGDRCCPPKDRVVFGPFSWQKKMGGGILTTKWGPHPPTNLPFSSQPPLYGRFQHRNPGDVGHVLDRKIHLRESSASKW